jgi:Na+/H+-dicarboxylate symporter/ABC-type amino acid transport substrate-binding protein
MPTLLSKIIPPSLGGKCIASVIAGVLVGFLLGEKSIYLEPIGIVFIRATTLLVLPYLIVEIIGVFGGLKREAMVALLKNGGAGIFLILLLASAVVVLTPSLLPTLPSSPLFNKDLLESHESTTLLDIFLPSNIFSALAAGNFPAVVIFSAAIGIVLQTMKDRESVLNLVEPLRKLFSTILSSVINHVTPIGIFAVTANAVGNAESMEFQRLLGLVALYAVSLSVIALVVLPGVLISFTRFCYKDIWNLVRDPLVLAISAGSVLITLPVLISNLRQILDPKNPEDEADFAPVEAMIPLGLTLFSLGKMTTTLFVPFAAWYFDAPMTIGRILAMLPSAIPTAMGRSSVAVIQEIPRAGLPLNLVSLFYMNEQWISRCSDIFTLTGVATMAFLLYSFLRKSLFFRPLTLVSFMAAAAVLALSMGYCANRILAATLSGSSHAIEIVMNRSSLVEDSPVKLLAQPPLPDSTSLARIKERGVLRAGLRKDSPPYVYQNSKGEIVGHDVDLLKSFAQSLGVRLELIEGDYRELIRWLGETRIDCAAGGLVSSGLRSDGYMAPVTYAKASFAVVVADTKIGDFQNRISSDNGDPLKIAIASPESASNELRSTIINRYSKSKHGSRIVFQPVHSYEEFATQNSPADAMLTTAEAGSAFAVIHPLFTMLPIFGKSLTADMVLLFDGKDEALPAYAHDWVMEGQNLDLLEQLEKYWILFKPSK